MTKFYGKEIRAIVREELAEMEERLVELIVSQKLKVTKSLSYPGLEELIDFPLPVKGSILDILSSTPTTDINEPVTDLTTCVLFGPDMDKAFESRSIRSDVMYTYWLQSAGDTSVFHRVISSIPSPVTFLRRYQEEMESMYHMVIAPVGITNSGTVTDNSVTVEEVGDLGVFRFTKV